MPDRVSDEDAYQELAAYTLSHRDPAFIHQHVVDAWYAQHATADDTPVRLAFALIGLFLSVERGYTGRQVQQVHRALGNRSRSWPTFPLPATRGAITVDDVLTAPAGAARDRAIDEWCRSVWAAYASTRPTVERLLRDHGVI